MTRRKHANIADAVVQLIAMSRSHKDVTRILETIAITLERDGDPEGAARLRVAKADNGPRGIIDLSRRDEGPCRWFAPAPLDAFVVGGDLRAALDTLADELAYADTFVAAGLDAPTRALFCGESGTGKTMAARWLGWKLGLHVAVLTLDATVKSHLGETSERIAKAFEEAARTPCILFLDEIDGLSGVRGVADGGAAGREMARTTSALLQRLDWLPPAQIVVAATNIPDAVDEAIRRRLPMRIDFPAPDAEVRGRMIDTWLARVPLDPELRDEIVRATEGMGGAAVRAFAMREGRALLKGERATRGSAAE